MLNCLVSHIYIISHFYLINYLVWVAWHGISYHTDKIHPHASKFYKQNDHIHVREPVTTALIDRIRSHLDSDTFSNVLKMKNCPTWTKTDGQSDTYLLVSFGQHGIFQFKSLNLNFFFFNIRTLNLYVFVRKNSFV